jgi:hypothetical protein
MIAADRIVTHGFRGNDGWEYAEVPEPACHECHGTGECPGWDEDGELVYWYPCGCLLDVDDLAA